VAGLHDVLHRVLRFEPLRRRHLDFADLIAASPAIGFPPKSELSATAIHRLLAQTRDEGSWGWRHNGARDLEVRGLAGAGDRAIGASRATWTMVLTPDADEHPSTRSMNSSAAFVWLQL
jgi:hypothetical protein